MEIRGSVNERPCRSESAAPRQPAKCADSDYGNEGRDSIRKRVQRLSLPRPSEITSDPAVCARNQSSGMHNLHELVVVTVVNGDADHYGTGCRQCCLERRCDLTGFLDVEPGGAEGSRERGNVDGRHPHIVSHVIAPLLIGPMSEVSRRDFEKQDCEARRAQELAIPSKTALEIGQGVQAPYGQGRHERSCRRSVGSRSQ